MIAPTVRALPAPAAGRLGWPWTQESPTASADLLDSSALPKLSIVTVTYNAALYLEETIRSVLLQGYPNLEYIIVDGGSTDGTVDIIKRYQQWIANWVSEPDRGQSHALNKGWAMATGDWLGWLNADDIYLPGVLNRITAAIQADPKLGLVYGDVLYVDAAGKPRDVTIMSEFSLHNMIMRGGLIHTPSVFWRRSLNTKAGGLNEDHHYAMDNDFWLRVVPWAHCRYLPGTMSTFRRHEGSKTEKSELALIKENFAIYRQRLQEAPYVSAVSEQEVRMVLGGFVWQMAVLLLRMGRRDESIQHFSEAIETYHIMETPDVAALRTVKKTLENHVLERQEITHILAALPLNEDDLRRFSQRVWEQYWQVQFYGGHQRGDGRAVLKSALPLLRSKPRRAGQRGFMSICMRSLAPSRI